MSHNDKREIEHILKKVPQYTRLKRHVSTLLVHSTPKKLLNLFAIELQYKMHRTKVTGYPYYLILDTGNICNLRCPLCPTGLRESEMSRKIMKFDVFKEIIDRLSPYAYEVTLYNWGEPFFNPDIIEMIRYCKKKNLGTNLSTNLNLENLDAESIINSGLEYLIVSLDGITQEVYEKYRVGGNIDLVFKNLTSIIKKKKDLKSKTPFIEWQYLVMKHNLHQIDEAREMAREIGVDLLRFIPVGLPFDMQNKKELQEKWYPFVPSDNREKYIEERFLQKPIEGGCFYLYGSVTINPEGHVAPCCMVWKDRDNFGNILDTDFMDIWNNDYYQSARSLFFSKSNVSAQSVCNRCPVFNRR
jgi:radical SAM protein with 4Fe4S-binding SPASM domain